MSTTTTTETIVPTSATPTSDNLDQTTELRSRLNRIEMLMAAGAVPGYKTVFTKLDNMLAGMWVLNPMFPWMTLDIVDPVTGNSCIITLYRCQVRHLGFGEMPTTTVLFERIESFGGLCSYDLGASIRKALDDQPPGDAFWVAETPVPGEPDIQPLFRGLHRAMLFQRPWDREGPEFWSSSFEPNFLWPLDWNIVLTKQGKSA